MMTADPLQMAMFATLRPKPVVVLIAWFAMMELLVYTVSTAIKLVGAEPMLTVGQPMDRNATPQPQNVTVKAILTAIQPSSLFSVESASRLKKDAAATQIMIVPSHITVQPVM